MHHTLTALLVLMLQVVHAACACAESPPKVDCVAAKLLPDSIVACVEVADLGGVVQTILNHPLRSKLEALPAYEGFMKSGALGQIQMGVRGFEASVGMPWQEAIDTLTDRGITVALDANDGGVAILVHSSDADLVERFRGFVLALRQMQGATAKQGDYRDFTADLISEQIKMVRMDDWLLVTNNSELGKRVIDQYLDRDGQTLSENENFVSAQEQSGSGQSDHRVAKAFFDIQAVRESGFAKDVFNEKIDNIAGEIVLGGVLANLRQTPFVSGQLDVSDAGLLLRLDTPHRREWEAPREYFFGEPELATAPQLLDVPNRLFAISTHRDLSQMWLRSGDLVSDRMSQMAGPLALYGFVWVRFPGRWPGLGKPMARWAEGKQAYSHRTGVSAPNESETHRAEGPGICLAQANGLGIP